MHLITKAALCCSKPPPAGQDAPSAARESPETLPGTFSSRIGAGIGIGIAIAIAIALAIAHCRPKGARWLPYRPPIHRP